MDETKQATTDPKDNEVANKDLVDLKNKYDELNINYTNILNENSKLKGELQEMHDAFKNNDVSKKEKTTKELSKELMG